MAIPVYDFRNDVRNVLVTPQIRSRFLRMEPGQVAQRHSHDLGHEVFLVLSGRAEFEIEGETVELGPGQICMVLADQLHAVRVVGDEPMTMYLSSPPTSSPPTRSGPRTASVSHRASWPPSAYDLPDDTATPLEALLDRHLSAAEAAAAQPGPAPPQAGDGRPSPPGHGRRRPGGSRASPRHDVGSDLPQLPGHLRPRRRLERAGATLCRALRRPMPPVRIGIIGCGAIAQVQHLPNLADCGRSSR